MLTCTADFRRLQKTYFGTSCNCSLTFKLLHLAVTSRTHQYPTDKRCIMTGMLTRPEVDEAEAKRMRPRPTLTRPEVDEAKITLIFSAKFYIFAPFSPKTKIFG